MKVTLLLNACIEKSPQGRIRVFLSSLVTVIALLVSGQLSAQTLNISGQVISLENDEPLPGVNIVVKGTTTGTVTDVDGNYRLAVPANAETLVFSSVGYTQEEIAINNQSTINLSMAPDIQSLSEIVVVGYGSIQKSDLTGSVASLKSEEMNQGPVVNVDQMLQSRAAGVQVFQNSSEPGGNVNIQIRGVQSFSGNNPLYVIDGIPIDNGSTITGTGEGFTASRTPRNPLNSINPNDIASIEILKDASAAAIYGARGANGVIIVTTKKGKAGKMQIDYDGYYGVQEVTKTLDVMTPEQYQTVLNELLDAGALNAIEAERVTEIQNGGTIWQDEVFRSAPIQSHNISLSGGNEATKYFASVGYFNQDGVVISSGLERYSMRFNLEQNLNDKLRIGLNSTLSYVEDDFVPNGVVPNETAGVIGTAIDFDPTLAIFNDDGTYQQSPFITKENPLAVAYGKEAIAKNFRGLVNLNAEYSFFPSLSLKVNLGTDYQNSRRDVFVDSRTEQGRDAGGIATVINGTQYNWLAEAWLNYDKTFGAHKLQALAGATAQKFFLDRFTAQTQGFVSEGTTTNNLQSGSPENNLVFSSQNINQLQSYLGRVIYGYDDRYLLTASVRADGSSRFVPDNKWSLFPSVALGWRVINEEFFPETTLLSDLKARVSYGQIGNQGLGNGQSQANFSPLNNAVVFRENQYVAYQPDNFPNPELRWETTTELNLGLDFGLFGNRITGSFEYYNRKTDDLLLEIPVPAQTGFIERWENAASIRNSGIELTLNTINLDGEFGWNTDIVISTNRNEVLELGGQVEQFFSGGVQFTQNLTIVTPGSPAFSYYGWIVDGVWQTDDNFDLNTQGAQAGDLKYRDINGDSTINADDRTIIGKPYPSFTWGLNNTFTYKGFTLDVALQGVHDVELMNNQLKDTYYPINFRRNKLAEPYLNRWTPENPSNVYPSFINPGSQGSNVINTYTVEDASFVRIQFITLGYQFPLSMSKLFKSLYLYSTVTNVATFTDYSGFNPGANIDGGAARIDYNAYPLARQYQFGVRLSF
ncbi:MAG: TonB-dependent receptor [Bacteroidota bacterium]